MQSLVAVPCCLVSFELVAQVAESIVNVDLAYSSRLSLFEVVNKEARGVKDSFVKERTLNYSLVAFLNELVN